MKRLFYILILLLSVTLSQSVASVTSIPFEISNGLILIKAQVNDNQQGTFIFDTGSSDVLINGTAKSSGALVFESLNGELSTQKVQLESLALGEYKKVGIAAYLTDLSGIESYVEEKIYGILSGAYFSPNEVFIDLKNKTIQISPSFDFKEYSEIYHYRLREENNIIVVDVPFKGKNLKFGLDSGASSHIISREYIDEHDLEYDIVETLDLINHTGSVETTHRIRTDNIIPNITSGNTFIIKDLGKFNTMTSSRLDGLLSVTSLMVDFVYINKKKGICSLGNFDS